MLSQAICVWQSCDDELETYRYLYCVDYIFVGLQKHVVPIIMLLHFHRFIFCSDLEDRFSFEPLSYVTLLCLEERLQDYKFRTEPSKSPHRYRAVKIPDLWACAKCTQMLQARGYI